MYRSPFLLNDRVKHLYRAVAAVFILASRCSVQAINLSFSFCNISFMKNFPRFFFFCNIITFCLFDIRTEEKPGTSVRVHDFLHFQFFHCFNQDIFNKFLFQFLHFFFLFCDKNWVLCDESSTRGSSEYCKKKNDLHRS